MTAVLVTGGKQYRVAEGDVIFVEKLSVEENTEMVFDTVAAVFEGDKVKTGTPYVEGASVTADVLKQGKEKKIIVYKMKPKKNYRRKQGHRQPYTQVKIGKIAV